MGDQTISRAELSAYFALRAAGDRLQRAVATQLKEHDLTDVQFTVLAQLHDAGELRMSDLADVIVASKNGLTYQAAQLERRGLIARRSSESDARSVLIRLEPAGAELLAEVFPGHIALVRELFLDRLTAKEIGAIASGLSKVAAD
ncbi:MarR family winged helix-turn-helix transcriptional regulator [Paramicrobacterium fandaimingii]|uniref:MarR family winged helix-turn-helix transcriptional regulator n=1 Tax=Paramicrobacterium fandaimingii TaxID=2708079 RepID=UPI0014219518|nr:MarR family transcriptional regulator [Microbacterium fandaimingii]